MRLFQAIEVKYLPVTNTKPSRWKATCSGGSVVRGYDHALNTEGNVLSVANELLVKMGWDDRCELRGGCLPSGHYAFVLVEKS